MKCTDPNCECNMCPDCGHLDCICDDIEAMREFLADKEKSAGMNDEFKKLLDELMNKL